MILGSHTHTRLKIDGPSATKYVGSRTSEAFVTWKGGEGGCGGYYARCFLSFFAWSWHVHVRVRVHPTRNEDPVGIMQKSSAHVPHIVQIEPELKNNKK